MDVFPNRLWCVLFFSLALLAKISPIKVDFSIFLIFLFLISFSIEEAETKVFFSLSSIICADKFFRDFEIETLNLLKFTLLIYSYSLLSF